MFAFRIGRYTKTKMVQEKFKLLTVSKSGQDGNIYIITLKKPPENRLNVEACQEIIRALRAVVSARCTSFDI